MITINLTNFISERNDLIDVLNRKITESKTTTVNSDIDQDCKLDVKVVTELLRVIEVKFRRCESLYYLYLDGAEHAVLAGGALANAYEREFTLMNGRASVVERYKVDDRDTYKELVDMNFQTFILTMASLYDLVRLCEIFLKKVIIHKTQSVPIHEYLEFFDIFFKLGYKQSDSFYVCISTSRSFLDQFLLQVNRLRNRYIHDHSINLETDGYNYYVMALTRKFISKSRDLLINKFSKDMLDHTRTFVQALLIALRDSASHPTVLIPV